MCCHLSILSAIVLIAIAAIVDRLLKIQIIFRNTSHLIGCWMTGPALKATKVPPASGGFHLHTAQKIAQRYVEYELYLNYQ